jgi:probable phosphoglycerate mutase
LSRLCLVRHGEPDLPQASTLFLGQIDPPLSGRGREQAACLKEALSGLSLDGAYASDLRRTEETARIVLGRRSCPLTLAPALREVALGAWEGKKRREIARREPEAYEARGKDILAFRPPGGESLLDVAARALPLLEAIMNQEGTFLVVTHAGVLRLFLKSLLDLPPSRLFSFRFDYGSLTIVERRGRKKEILCLNGRSLPEERDRPKDQRGDNGP